MNLASERSRAVGYFAAFTAPLLIAGASALSWPLVEANPVSGFLIAVILSSWFGGYIPGILSLAFSFVIVSFLFIEPYFVFGIPGPRDAVRLVIVGMVGTFIALVCEVLRREKASVEERIIATRTSEEGRFRAVADCASDAIVVIDEESKILYANETTEKIFGYTAAELIGDSITALMPADFRPRHIAGMAAFVRSGERRFSWESVELPGEHKNGSPIPLEISFGEFGRDGKRNFAGIIRDVSHRKAAEDRHRRLHEELEERVADRTAQLQAANSELESFSYSVSHDLRAPLRHINGFSQALLEDFGDKLDDTAKGYLNEVRGATREMADLIDDLLLLARVTRSGMDPEPVDLSSLASDVIAELEKMDPTRMISFAVEPGLSAVCDRRLTRILLMNLFGNAWKFTSKVSNAQAEFGRTDANGRSRFFVRDNGAGFDMTYSNKLFQAFQRLHSAKEFEGTGIGLATVRRVVTRHGGLVAAEGEVGKGAVFYFTLGSSEGGSNGIE